MPILTQPPNVPITPMPAYSIMETPKLKKELNRFGVRALSKRKMVLKLKEIFQYTHQVMGSDSEDEIPSSQPPPQKATTKHDSHVDGQPFSASQKSAASSVGNEEGGKFETCVLASEEEEGIPASQAAAWDAEKLKAVRRYIHSNPALYRRILLYQPLELTELQAELKENGIKISLGKLVDFLDSHCVTFTTARARKEKQQQHGGKKKGRKRY
uniref:Structure-specific endonuclease subunit SLX4 n=1 Tax=Sphenodon punctatus TaxID=8508 RepID=A0A8D0HNA3_SPHPU